MKTILLVMATISFGYLMLQIIRLLFKNQSKASVIDSSSAVSLSILNINRAEPRDGGLGESGGGLH
jgi:hypothetical protein